MKTDVANTACHTRVAERATPGTTAHAADAVRDARLALRAMGLTLKQGDALVGVALAQLPPSATAAEIVAAAFRAMR